MSYTKGKWELGNTNDKDIIIVGPPPAKKYICTIVVKQMGGGAISEAMEDERIANAHRIVTCCNSHDALVERIEALEELLVCYRIGKRPTEKLHKKLDKTKAALKQAGGEK